MFRIGNVVIEDVDDTIICQSLQEKIKTANQLEFNTKLITMEAVDETGNKEADGSEDIPSVHSSQIFSSSPTQVAQGNRITDFFSPITKSFTPRKLDSDVSSNDSSDELSQALNNLTSLMDRLNHLQQIPIMLGNIHASDSSPFSNHVKQIGSSFKPKKNRSRKKCPSISDSPNIEFIQVIPSVTGTPITVKDLDSVASMDVITKVSNYYEGSLCDTSSISERSNDDGIDNSFSVYEDIPDLIDVVTIKDADTLDTPDASETCVIGGRMKTLKDDNVIRIFGCNPNGIRSDQLKSQLQHSLDLDIDILIVIKK